MCGKVDFNHQTNQQTHREQLHISKKKNRKEYITIINIYTTNSLLSVS